MTRDQLVAFGKAVRRERLKRNLPQTTLAGLVSHALNNKPTVTNHTISVLELGEWGSKIHQPRDTTRRVYAAIADLLSIASPFAGGVAAVQPVTPVAPIRPTKSSATPAPVSGTTTATRNVTVAPAGDGFSIEATKAAVKQLEALGLPTAEVKAAITKKLTEMLGF